MTLMRGRPRPGNGIPGRVGTRNEAPAGAGGPVVVAGRYRLERRLGVWAGSVIWGAVDEALGRPVTIWAFPPGFGRASAVVAAARAACQLEDPRLARVFDADDHGGRLYVVTEREQGGHLGELVTAGPVEPDRAAAMVAGAAAALARAHASGLAHLCLRPPSLWCNSWGEITVSGLGIAAAAAGAQATDPALADTRGLGQLLYAALTGYWPGTEKTTLPAAPLRGPQVAPPGQVRAGIPSQIDAVACQALSGEPGCATHRPILHPAQLAQELAEATGAPAPRLGRTAAPAAPASPSAPVTTPLAPPAARNPDLQDTVPARTPPRKPAPPASAASPPPAAASPPQVNQAATVTSPVPPPTTAASSVAPGQWSRSPARPPGLATEPEPRAPAPTAPPSARRRYQGTEPTGPPAPSAQPARHARRAPSRLKAVLAGMVMVAIVAVLAAGGWLLARPGSGRPGSAPASGPASPSSHPAAAAGAAWQALSPASARAFDPYGNGQPDNSQLVPLAIDHNPATAWHTDWYTTAHFGNLKPGTGLLLTMGRAITLARARIKLGSTPGADLQLRAGTTAATLQDLPVTATATNAGGWASLHLRKPVHARYLLIWFTRLPPDPAGTFQASIYGIQLKGRP
jgi:eukaryotic-like serine/threonine-protein kinase